MKNRVRSFLLLSIASLALSAATQAQELVLNTQNMVATTNPVVVVRTASTPKKVELRIPVQMANSYCAEYGTVMVFGPDSSCGYDYYRESYNRCEPYYSCREEMFCPPGGRPGDCRRRSTCSNENRCWTDYREMPRMRSCNHAETRCVRTDYNYSTEHRLVVLRFNKAARLSGSQMEKFEIQAHQNGPDGGDAYVSGRVISAQASYDIDNRDGLFTGFKDQLNFKAQ